MKLDAQDIHDLKPLIAEAVRDVLKELAGTPLTSGQLAFNEAQAAELIGLKKHQLRDARLRGQIRALRPPGTKNYLYTRGALLEFVEGGGNEIARKGRSNVRPLRRSD